MINVIEHQSLFDIGVRESGSVLTAFDWAIKNGLSITDSLTPGQQLIEVVSAYSNADVGSYFKERNQMVATGFKNEGSIIPTLGIGTMRIGTTFIVG
jgi:capsid protein